MTRLRHRPTSFMWHGDSWAFHRIADGTTLGRLDPYSEDAQVWPLHSGKVIAVTGADVRDITLQVHGIELPETRPEGGFANSAAIDARLDAIEARQDAFDARLTVLESARAETKPEPTEQANEPAEQPEPPLPDKPVPDDPVQLPPNPAEAKLSEYGEVGSDPVEEEITTDHLLTDMKKDAGATQDVIAKLSREKRRKFTELLTVEQAELRNKINVGQGDDHDAERKRDVERLLNLFARVGEA